MVGVMAGGAVMDDLESMVVEIVSSLSTALADFDLQFWKSKWKAAYTPHPWAFRQSAHGQNILIRIHASLNEDELATVEVVPASHEAEYMLHDLGYWEAEWVATELGIVVTSEELRPQRFEFRGRVHVWSLRTGKVVRSIEVPARLQAIVGDRKSPWVIVGGGPSGKYTGTPFVWRVNIYTGEVVDRFGFGMKPMKEGTASFDQLSRLHCRTTIRGFLFGLGLDVYTTI